MMFYAKSTSSTQVDTTTINYFPSIKEKVNSMLEKIMGRKDKVINPTPSPLTAEEPVQKSHSKKLSFEYAPALESRDIVTLKEKQKAVY
jgi:SET domain-containing protein